MSDMHVIASNLRAAYAGAQIARPLQGLAAEDTATAYRIQDINTGVWQDAGRRQTGRKIGLTSKAVQAQLGADAPNHGVLFADTAIPDGGEIMLATKLLQPKAEAEVALVMERDLALPDATVADVIRCTAYAAAAIEIVDSRFADWKISVAHMIADNACAAAYVLSSAGKSLRDLDLLTCGMILEINGQIASLGAGAACFGHPLRAAAWLARALAQSSSGLAAGDVILTGALGPMAPIAPGDHVQVRIGGLGIVSAFAPPD